MAPKGPYKVDEKYFVIVRYVTPKDIPAKPNIHVGFSLYPTTYKGDVETYDHLSTQKRPGFTYVRAKTPRYDDAGNMFALIAGIPTMPQEEVAIHYSVAAGNDASEQQECRHEVAKLDLVRVIESYLPAGEEAEFVTLEGEVRFDQRDGRHVWFGVLEVDVKYTNLVGDTRPAPGSGG